MKKVELLAPAGNYACFEAAIKAGADAVYLGLNMFGARASADNFSEDELIQALKKAHLLGKKIYLTVNTLLKDSELSLIYDCIHKLYLNGLDGVIVQDIGVMKVIGQSFPKLDLHASTQMAITDVDGVEFARKLGVTRVVPARELSLNEISNIYNKTGMELECFIHGALCYSYSGKCLFSSFLGGRSGNRGRCAQPCRLPYDGQYLLSMKDLCTIDMIPELIEAGIASFKIEGRMKSPEYVYGVTSLYRKYIDEYNNSGKCEVSNEDKSTLLSLYTRGGNCKGYYNQKNGRNMITITSPSYESKGSEVNLNELPYPRIPIKMTCDIFRDMPIRMSIELLNVNGARYNENHLDYVFDVVPETAKSSGATVESVKKQLIKCGATDFAVNDCIINIDEGLFISNGQLNRIRRECLENVEKHILNKYYRDDDSERYVDVIEKSKKRSECCADACSINVSVINYSQLDEVVNDNIITGVIIPIGLIDLKNDSFMNAITCAINSKKNIFLRFPYIVRAKNGISGNDIERIFLELQDMLEKEYDYSIAGVYVSNYESIEIVNRLADGKMDIISDIHMYCMNSESVEKLKAFGVTCTTTPVELCENEIKKRNITGEELIIYGRMPMVVSSQCILKTTGKCNKCNVGNSITIRDRKDAELFCYTDCIECTNVIYNSVPNSILLKKELLDALNPASLRLDFTDESVSEIKQIVKRLSVTINDGSPVELCEKYTRGHLNKGVD